MMGRLCSPEDAAAAWRRILQERNARLATRGHKRAQPPRWILESLARTAFYASFAAEEGVLAKGALLFCDSRQRLGELGWSMTWFRPQRTLAVAEVAKLSPALKPGSDFLIVERQGKSLVLSGMGMWPTGASPFMRARGPVAVSFIAPGHLVMSSGSLEDVRYFNGEIVAAGRPLFGEEHEDALLPAPFKALRQRIIGRDERQWVADGWLYTLVREMRRARRGGIIAVCADHQDVVGALASAKHGLAPPIALGKLMAEARQAQRRAFEARVPTEGRSATAEEREALRRETENQRAAERDIATKIALVGRMSAIDGALIASPDLDIVAVGAKLQVDVKASLPEILYADTFPPAQWQAYPLDSKGMRHRSAVLWVSQDERRAAFIVSQDGHAGLVGRTDVGLTYWPLPYAPPWFMSAPGGG